MQFLKSMEIISMLLVTILLVNDYFPSLSISQAIPKKVLLGLIIGMIIISNLFNRYKNSASSNIFKWGVWWLLYFIFLLGLLTVLGGKSRTDISFDNGFMWVVILLSVIELFSKYKKAKQNEAWDIQKLYSS